MEILESMFGPARDEIWEMIARDVGGEYEQGGAFGRNALRYRSGKWEISVDTYSSGDANNLATYTRIRAPFINKDGLYFKICREGLFSPVAKFLGAQDIEVGDEYFDDAFTIKGNNEEKIKKLLQSPKLKALIQAQPDISFEIRDDDGWFSSDFPEGVDELYFECVGLVHEEERVKALFDLFSTTLSRLVQIDSAYEDDPEIEL